MNRTAALVTGAVVLIAASSPALTFKLGSLAPSGSPWDDGLRQIAAEWNTISGGKVVLKIYPGGVAGDEEDMIRKMRIGQLQAAGLTGIGLCRVYSGILAIQLPLLVRTDEELYHVLDKMKPEFAQGLEKEGFVVLIWTKVGWAHFFSKRPVVSPDDLKQHKLFMYAGDADAVQTWKVAGFRPIPLSPTDIMSSLQSGMTEALTTTPLSAASYQWFGIANNMCGMNWAPLIGGIVVTTTAWNKVPADMRPKLMEVAAKVERTLQKQIDEADAEAIRIMKEHGLTVNAVPPEIEEQWKKLAHDSFGKLAGKSFDASSYEKVKQYLSEFRQADANR
jgi:TRAP-type C4-dicarboxylate transport system substrate-binding protein